MAIFKFLRNYSIYAILAFCLFANSTPLVPHGIIFYLLGVVLCFVYAFWANAQFTKGKLYWLFLLVCYLSSLFNMVFDYRLFVFTLVIIIFSPILYSEKLREFREKYLIVCLQSFPLVSLICFYCYVRGINLASTESGDVSWDFSAIFPHPMWLGAVAGVANVVCLWNILNVKRILFQILWGTILLLSVYLSVVSASRSALVASLCSMLLLVFYNVANIKKFIKYLVVISFVGILAFPVYYNNSQRMQNKVEVSTGKYGSRSGIWNDGFAHFKEQPVLGCGFAVSYRDGHREQGRLESGSGWLSVLFQTGISGFSVLVLILIRLRHLYMYIRDDRILQFFIFPFLFLCLHSLFEGYILTSGHYLCIMFWALLSYLYTYDAKCDNELDILE